MTGRTLAGFLVLWLALAGPALAKRNDHLSEQDRADLERISDYLNSIKTLRGEFIQISDSGGVAKGKFWLRKPGRLRFEYDPPVPIVLIADGTVVAVEDKELETVNTYPLSATPLKLILARKIRLAKDADITGVIRREDQIIVTAREDEGVAQGQITMFFKEPELALRQWVIIDAQGVETSVSLLNVVAGERIPNSLFEIEKNDGWDD